MAEITVVITAHNSGDMLQVALDSVLAQTFEDYECIIVDDASTPPAETLVHVEDPRVTFLRLEANVGVSMARNIAVSRARTPWIAFLDHDDTWSPDKLLLQHKALLGSPGAWLSYTAFEWLFADGTRLADPLREVTYLGLLADQMVNMSSIVVSKAAYEQVGGCNPLLVWAQDHDLILKLVMFGPPPVWVKDCVTQYHLHGGNHSSNYLGSITFRRLVIEQHERRARAKGDDRVLPAARRGRERADELMAAQSFDAARAAHRRGQRTETARELARHLRARASLVARRVSARGRSLRGARQQPEHGTADPRDRAG
ncbi:glycosyltransferase family 2 protein [Monashia sp. NPDC004114]